jgi:hypothetical protein
MSRLLFALVAGLLLADSAAAFFRQRPAPRPAPVCHAPVYPLTSAVWGGPAPAFVPPPPPPVRPVPKPAVREDDDPAPPPAPKKTESPAPPEKPKEDPPKIKPKVLIPGEPPAKLSADPVEADDGTKPFNQYLVPADTPKAEPSAEVKVGFFNHSSRELVLTVHGEEVKLPGGQFVTLRLPRSFEWGEKGKKAASVTVPNDADGVEIVFRK